jgi:hypothetical protein
VCIRIFIPHCRKEFPYRDMSFLHSAAPTLSTVSPSQLHSRALLPSRHGDPYVTPKSTSWLLSTQNLLYHSIIY